MLYTPQQLAGGSKYSRGVRVGNWYEDDCYEKTKMRDFNAKKSQGSLISSREASKLGVLRQAVPHSFSADGMLKYGDTIMLKNAKSNGFFSVNIFEELQWGSGERVVRAEQGEGKEDPAAAACNTLVITRDEQATASGMAGSGPTLSYGDVFYLCSNPSLMVDKRTNMRRAPLFLTSAIRSVASGLPDAQTCSMNQERSRDSRWKVQPLDLRRKVIFEGKPVPANQAVLLQHVSSKHLLAVDVSRGTLIVKDFKCKNTKKCVAYGTENHFSIVTARDQRQAVDNRTFTTMTPEVLFKKIRDIVNERGNYGIRGLGRSFRIMDDRGDGMLDKEDFRYGLADYGIQLSADEFAMVMDSFDSNKDGFVSFDEFLGALRGPMNARRKGFVQQAYNLLDADGSGVVDIKDIESSYDASQHPDVKSGKRSKTEVFTEFMKQWDKSGDGVVSTKEFYDYFRDVSASIDSDDYFELMMRNAWHISGGKGQLENTTCRRVLVTFVNGTQAVKEIKNDLGLKKDDIEGMIRRLEAQGINGIRSVQLYG